MKTLTNHKIIYDDECPMCDLYTGAFIKHGLLDQDGRIKYSACDFTKLVQTDRERAKDFIALVNGETGETTYGLESIFKILGHRYAWLRMLFRARYFAFTLSRLYKFISYNRKVIIPSGNSDAHACVPTFNYHYRLAYVVLAWAITSYVLTRYATLLGDLLPATTLGREFMICGGQILFQAMVLVFANLTPARIVEYLGNMMTVSLAGSLLLLPVVLLSPFLILTPVAYAAYFMLVVSWMFFEHARRMRLLRIGAYISVSWVIYRLIVLLILLWR